MRVLVVEDDSDIATLITSAFRRDGAAHVEVVGTGSDALRVVDAEAPELMIFDLNLPDIDGFTPCRMVRARQAAHRFQ
tara:strand:- start:105 stop:338 length:234 start_codon:yes stop_codon:yes gene_type:complete